MSNSRLGIGIIGAGNIAGRYVEDLMSYPELHVIGVTDLISERAQQLAQQFDCRAYASPDDLLADDAIQLVVNLTIFDAHKDVSARALDAGKHVYSEKPLAMNSADAHALVAYARAKNLRLGCSPMVFMGEAQQTAWQWIRDGRLGNVRVAFADAHNGRIETWHPAPEPFYRAGILFDVGVYPLTILTTFLGAARRVRAYGKVLMPERVTKEGRPFQVEYPEFVSLDLEMASGTLVKLATSYYVSSKTKQAYA
ncbi:MAG: Gfo/Idh/MocA family oxidoreductase, partial [Chloroflexi bacterium]|nr:Gfo/Idh/MocA family oxidoreductase [Chloroflexota bacterium]